MAGYNRVATPRAYVDLISYNLAHGWSAFSNITVLQDDGSTAVTFDAGTKESMFDLRPSNYAQIAHDTQAFYIQYNTEFATDTLAESNFLAILGHNFHDADAVFKVEISDNSVFPTVTNTDISFDTNYGGDAADDRILGTGRFGSFASGDLVVVSGAGESGNNGTFTVETAHANYLIVSENLTDEAAGETVTVEGFTRVSTTANHTKVINAAADAGAGYIDPASNGWTLITWSTQTSDNQYLRITIEDDGGTGTNFDEDVQIGSILYGEYIDLSSAPDLNVQTSVDYDGTKLQSSSGGNTFANSQYFGQPSWAATPAWINSTTAGRESYSFEKRYGRMSHSMNYSFVTDSDLFAPNQHHGTPSNWFDSSDLHSQFYNKILGQHNPFLFALDKDSTTEGDYGLFRLANGGLSANQVAYRTWNTSLNIVETW